MYKSIVLLLLVLGSTSAFAKQVKFAVDMTGQTISPNGVHVTGDFQAIAGYAGGDWVSNTTTLTQEGSTNIYSITIDLPAFAKYEYKFVNGDQFYDAEFVPVESRVGYDFNDNRWIYLDSTDNGVFSTGEILFGGNAPAGKTLIRFLVNMNDETVSPDGVHVAGDFQGNDPVANILYSFGNGVYEGICFVDAGMVNYKFYNGNESSDAETVPSSCAVAGNRQATLSADLVLEVVCFSSCSTCLTTGVDENAVIAKVSLYPNPTSEASALIVDGILETVQVDVKDLKGRTVSSQEGKGQFTLEKTSLKEGIYFVQVSLAGQPVSNLKWVVR